MKQAHIEIQKERIEEFCRRRHIRKLAIFGSVLRDDFHPDSDVDVLVEFDPDADDSFDRYLETQDFLTSLFGRHVDLVEKSAIRNPFRRHSILTSQEVIYAAA